MLPPQTPPAPDSPEFSPLAIGEDLTPLPEYKAAGTTEIGFDGLLAEPLRLREDLASGCGGQTWPAGMVLGRHMLRYHREDLGEARILELGAGGGLVGLAVASGCKVGTNPLFVTDQLEMHALMEHNIVLNNLEGKVKAAILNWGEPLPPTIVDLKPNVILAADCVYFEPAFPLLLATLSDLLKLCPEATIYFCFKKRRRADMQFLKKAQKMFKVTEIADEERPVFSREGLFLYTFQAST
ncbi:putative methyltransferase-domain-containing protein [Annulohypoxylon nitens]|nr:putative methyltransferase-domain-containing protein [Annulohypoxylon nitens]